MKGIIFTEFLEMVEKDYGFEVLNRLIDNSNLPSSGVYSGVGTYDYKEFTSLLLGLSEVLDLDTNRLLKKFGYHVFETFRSNYSVFFENVNHPFQLLEQVDSHVHKEVLKLYPDAQLPKFNTVRRAENKMDMLYDSTRRMEYFALGLIEASLSHFKKEFSIEMTEEIDGKVLFKIELK
jgi:hypothetical protein